MIGNSLSEQIHSDCAKVSDVSRLRCNFLENDILDPDFFPIKLSNCQLYCQFFTREFAWSGILMI